MNKWRALLVVAVVVLSLAVAANAFAAPPPNDMFADATPLLSSSGSIAGTTVDSTVEPNEPASWMGQDPPPNGTIWYKWKVGASGQAKFWTISDSTQFDPVILTATGATVDTLVVVAHDDDGGRFNPGAGIWDAQVMFEATAGETYYIRLTGYPWGDIDPELTEGDFVLWWDFDGPAWSISDDLTPQQVCMNLPVAIKVHPTIQMDTDVEYLEYNCANPLTNNKVAFAFDWTVKSNVPWWKRIEASNLALGTYDERSHSWITAPGTGYVFNSLKMGPDGFPVQGEYEEVMLNDVVAADRIKLTITDEDGTVHEGNPWWSEVIGDADTHEDTERVGYEVDFNWCDTAGWYGGYVWLCAFQN